MNRRQKVYKKYKFWKRYLVYLLLYQRVFTKHYLRNLNSEQKISVWKFSIPIS